MHRLIQAGSERSSHGDQAFGQLSEHGSGGGQVFRFPDLAGCGLHFGQVLHPSHMSLVLEQGHVSLFQRVQQCACSIFCLFQVVRRKPGMDMQIGAEHLLELLLKFVRNVKALGLVLLLRGSCGRFF